jgi:hypothetical protein
MNRLGYGIALVVITLLLSACIGGARELLASGAKIDPLPLTVGCFDLGKSYPTDRLVLTYPVRCKD